LIGRSFSWIFQMTLIQVTAEVGRENNRDMSFRR